MYSTVLQLYLQSSYSLVKVVCSPQFAAALFILEEVPARISEDLVSPKIHSKASVCKNILRTLHCKGGVCKNILLQTQRFWRHLLQSVISYKYFCRHLKYNTFFVALPLLMKVYLYFLYAYFQLIFLCHILFYNNTFFSNNDII